MKDKPLRTLMVDASENDALLIIRELKNKRQRAENELQENGELYRLLADQSIVGMHIIQDGRIKYVNHATAKITGYSIEEMMNWEPDGYRILLHPDELPYIMEQVRKKQTGDPNIVVRYTWRIITKSGETKWVESFSKTALFEGSPADFVMIIDITERKQAEEELRKSEQMYRKLADNYQSIVENTSEGIYRSTPGGHYLMANYAFARILGYDSPEELLCSVTNISKQIYVDGKARKESIRRTLESGHGYFEIQFKRKDGSVGWLANSVRVVRNKQGEIEYYEGITKDITERKRNEENLAQSEKKFSSIFHLSPDSISISEIDTGILIDVNQAYTRATGYSREELIGSSVQDLRLWVNPEVRQKIIGTLTTEGEVNNVEVLIRQKNGNVRNVLFSARFIEIERERYLLSLGNDITERKQAEEKYRNIFENAQEGIYQSTPEGRFIMANQSMARILGYDSSEDLTVGVTDIARQLYVDPEERTKFTALLEQYGFARNPEVRFYKKNGNIIWVSLTARVVINEKKQILYYEGIIADITDRKENVKRLRKTLGGTVQAIASLVETRDPYTAGHQRRVADLARVIAVEMNLPSDRIEGLCVAAVIHDIGKISIPVEILSKPTKLTKIEFKLIKTHSQSGYDILKDIEFPWPIARMVIEHHERMNGSGYPNGLTGENLLLESRILAVADVVEAMASHRPYRASPGVEPALEEIEKNKGILYDQDVADACLRLFRNREKRLAKDWGQVLKYQFSRNQ